MIGIIGGTGPQGKGLAYRLSTAGIDVLLGSRNAEKAQTAAAEVADMGGTGAVGGAKNADLPPRCEMLLVTTPYDGMQATLAPLTGSVDGQVVMSAVNNLGFAGGPHPIPVEAGSSAHEIAQVLPGARVVTAFNNVSAVHLIDPTHVFDEDVLVCGDDPDAVAATVALIDQIGGLRGVTAGSLVHAPTIEAITAVIISVNKAHKVNAGIHITGL